MKSRIVQDTKILFLVGIAGVALMLSLGACGAGDLGSDTALAADASVGEMQNIDTDPMAEVGDDHTHAPGTDDQHSHDDVIEIEEGQTHPTVALSVKPDPMSGWNVQVEVTNFRFAPENASGADVLGEGHAHLYVDGEKLARLYGEWFHIAQLEPGTHEVAVSLNGNSHAAYYYAGEPVEASVTVEVEQ